MLDCDIYDKVMLSTSTATELAARLQEALTKSGLTKAELARQCSVSKQAVQSWIKTGRIDKVRLLQFADVTKTTVHELLGQTSDSATPATGADYAKHTTTEPHTCEDNQGVYSLSSWPFTTFTAAQYMALPPETRSLAEGFIRGLIAAGQTKSNGTTGHE